MSVSLLDSYGLPLLPPDLYVPTVPPELFSFTSRVSHLWEPPERLPLSQWAEKNITLSSEYAANTGDLHLFGWQKEIFDSFTDPSVSEIDLMMARQLSKTIFIQSALCFVIDADPGPVLILEPDENAARAFSKERLGPMIRDCECLRLKISDGSREGNQILMKEFPGGSAAVASARSSSNLRRRSNRYLFGDEIDAYPANIGTAENKEGDPVAIAIEGMETYGSRSKLILASSPTTAGLSRIGKAYADSDQRKPYATCPLCGYSQILKFFRDDGKGGVWFDTSLPRAKMAASARYECGKCHGHWTELQRKTAANASVWKAHKPFEGRAGFWISQLYSPWSNLAKVVSKFLLAKDDINRYRTFYNTVLGELWEETGETPDPVALYNRREGYPFGKDAVIPRRGLFLTSAVDVQESPPRLEVETVAWGRNGERWSIDYQVLQVFADNGQPLPVTSLELWAKLDADVLQRSWKHELGQNLSIMVMAIDTGMRPKPVYDFALRHPQLSISPNGMRVHAVRTVMPVKGKKDQLRVISSVSDEDAARKQRGVKIVGIGTHCCKQQIYDLLRTAQPKINPAEPNPGFYHFPHYDLVYFEGMCSEVRLIKENGDVEYVKRGRNEPFDLAVYNLGAAMAIGMGQFTEKHWRQLERIVGATQLTVETTTTVEPPADPSSPPSLASSPSSPTPIPSVALESSAARVVPVVVAAAVATAPPQHYTPQRISRPVRRPIRGRFQ